MVHRRLTPEKTVPKTSVRGSWRWLFWTFAPVAERTLGVLSRVTRMLLDERKLGYRFGNHGFSMTTRSTGERAHSYAEELQPREGCAPIDTGAVLAPSAAVADILARPQGQKRC